MTEPNKNLIIAIALVAGGLIALIILTPIVANSVAPASASTSAASTCTVIDYGNGILYFNCQPYTFGAYLSEYRKNHSDTRIVSISNDGNNYFNYFVITEPAPTGGSTCPPP